MDHSHHVIEALKTGTVKSILGHVAKSRIAMLEVCNSLADFIRRAHKFDFSQVREVAFGLAGNAVALAKEGLLPVPYNECWLELGTTAFGVETFGPRFGDLACALEMVSIDQCNVVPFMLHQGAISLLPVNINIFWQRTPKLMSEVRLLECVGEHIENPPFGDDTTELLELLSLTAGHAVINAFAFLSSLNAKDETVLPSAKLNKAREKRGVEPTFSHHVVKLAMHGEGDSLSIGGHASPRLHWRRGHPRTLPTGVRILVRPCLVGDIEKGFVSKSYRAVA